MTTKTFAAATVVMLTTATWLYAKGGGAPAGRCTVEVTATVTPNPAPDPYRTTTRRRPVDLVICLDTSGSMTALIDSARAKLWEIVNEVTKEEPTPRLRVGLLTYGSPSNSTHSRGWIVRHTDLTSDLDTAYARMMSMNTNGGDEFVGWVLHDALRTMSWSTDPDAVRLIFVAGNESADQAAHIYNFRHVAESARARGIFINSIYAGDRGQGIRERWDQVAVHGGGRYFAIDAQYGTDQISTPLDKILIELNAKLNATYIPFGERGAAGAANQREQDRNAAKLGQQSATSRVTAKSSEVYDNSDWDLVDAAEKEGVAVEELPATVLPPVMQAMAPEERGAYVAEKKEERARIQRQIQDLSQQRSDLLEAATARGRDGRTSLDDAVRSVVREQLDSNQP